MTFVAQDELLAFSTKRFILENVLNFSDTRPWPVKKSSVPHKLRNLDPEDPGATFKLFFCIRNFQYLNIVCKI